jgi:hypothetical protein
MAVDSVRHSRSGCQPTWRGNTNGPKSSSTELLFGASSAQEIFLLDHVENSKDFFVVGDLFQFSFLLTFCSDINL